MAGLLRLLRRCSGIRRRIQLTIILCRLLITTTIRLLVILPPVLFGIAGLRSCIRRVVRFIRANIITLRRVAL